MDEDTKIMETGCGSSVVGGIIGERERLRKGEQFDFEYEQYEIVRRDD